MPNFKIPNTFRIFWYEYLTGGTEAQGYGEKYITASETQAREEADKLRQEGKKVCTGYELYEEGAAHAPSARTVYAVIGYEQIQYGEPVGKREEYIEEIEGEDTLGKVNDLCDAYISDGFLNVGYVTYEVMA